MQAKPATSPAGFVQGLQASDADGNALGTAVFHDGPLLDVDLPTPFGLHVRVTYVVPELWSPTTDIASCHLPTPYAVREGPRGDAPRLQDGGIIPQSEAFCNLGHPGGMQ